jgi:hypothetical protein
MSERVFRPPRQPLTPPGDIECHAADFTAAISAQMSLASAQQRLLEFDQWIPIDGDPQSAIGQLVERNSTGPLRLGFGAWRDLLLGCQLRLRNGQLITAGGRTVKNVAGYDLTKFAVGQRGRFGSLVTITTRTYKRPRGALLAELPPSNELFGQIILTPLRPTWAVLSPQALVCGWLDDEAALDLFERLLSPHEPLRVCRRSLAQDISHRAQLWFGGPNMFKAAVPPARICLFVKKSGLNQWAADPAFGIVIGPLDQIDETVLALAARAVGGSVTMVKEDQLQWQGGEAEERVLNELQKAFEVEGEILI